MATRLTGQRCRCTACGEHFRKSSTFTKHRLGSFGRNILDPGTRRCLTVAEMEAKGWRKRADGFWVGAPRPDGTWNDTQTSETAEIGAEAYQGGGVAEEAA